MENYRKNVFLDLISKYQKGQALDKPEELSELYRKILKEDISDRLYLTKLLSLSSEKIIGDYFQMDDIDAVHYCHHFVSNLLAIELKNDFEGIYESLNSNQEYHFNHIQWGNRALKNLCLFYLALSGDKQWLDQAVTQYNNANNMTDAIGAIQALNNISCDQREDVLNNFHRHWKNEPLQLDKWFSFQGSSTIDNGISRVRQLSQSSEFVLTNPNRVRALLSAFSNNRMHFHCKNGEGYQLLGDFIQQLDPINPQVSARLATAFSQWERLNLERQNHIHSVLKKILDNKKLSVDVYEIVSKTLKDS